MDLFKYKVWCVVENIYVSVWGENEPTVCPNNNTHSIDSNKTQIIDQQLDIVPRDPSGKERVHQTSRPLGLKTFFTGAGDDITDITDIGNGTLYTTKHFIGDDLTTLIYLDLNIVENETWLHEGYIVWKNCDLDIVTLELVNQVTEIAFPGISTAVFSNSSTGLNDCISSGTYTGVISKKYKVEIDNTGTIDTFKFSNDNGNTWESENIQITGNDQELENGVIINFNSITGHTLDDSWNFLAVITNPNYKLYNNYLIVSNTFPYGDLIDIMSDISNPHKGLITMPKSNAGDDPTAYWNADWNSTEKKYENILFDITGQGNFNMFAVELSLGKFVNRVPLVGNGFEMLQCSDIEKLGQGMRIKSTAITNIVYNDHDWSLACVLTLYRKHV